MVSHKSRRPVPYYTQSPQPLTSVASSPSLAGTLMKSGAPDWGPPVEQTCQIGGTGGGVDSPPPGWLWFTEDVVEKSVPRDLSVRTLSLGIPPQGPSIGKWYPERTPYTVLVSCPYPDPPPPPPWGGGRWGGLSTPNSMLPLLMVCERHGLQVDSALRTIYPLVDYLPIGEYLYHHFPSVGLRWPCMGCVTWQEGHAHSLPLVGKYSHLSE